MSRLLLTTALCLGIAAPAFAVQPAEGEKLAENQSYTFWLLDAIKTSDPHKNSDVEGSDIIRQLFEGLLNEDTTGAPIAGVATSFDLSDDKLTYTFHLRPEAKWSNGDPLTAQDFVYSWQRLANPETASEYAWFMELMNVQNATAVVKGEKPPAELGIKAVDDHTLTVTLTTPTPYFPKMVTHASTFPVNQKVVEAEGDAWTQPGKLVGNGAYVLTSRVLGVQGDIQRLEEMLTETRSQLTEGNSARGSLAAISGEIRIAESDLVTRQELLAAAAAQMESARIEANKQVRYLAVSIAPVPPDEATYPKAFQNTIVAFLIFSGVYLMMSLTASILREQVSS